MRTILDYWDQILTQWTVVGNENKQRGPESSNQSSKNEYFVSRNIASKIKCREREAKTNGPNNFSKSSTVNDVMAMIKIHYTVPWVVFKWDYHINTMLDYRWKQVEYWITGQIPNNKLYWFRMQQHGKFITKY